MRDLVAFTIVAHAADITRLPPGARDRYGEITRACYKFDWSK